MRRATPFWLRVEIKRLKDCWNWIGRVHQNGYGLYDSSIRKSAVRAHRMAWMLSRGQIPDGKFVLHKCDNRRCCNPKHLFIGTLKDNMQDASKKGRVKNNWPKGINHHNSKKTHCKHGHAFTEDNTRIYKERRVCKTCHRLANRKKTEQTFRGR